MNWYFELQNDCVIVSLWLHHHVIPAKAALEVRKMFRVMVKSWFRKSRKEYNGFIQALLEDDVKGMNFYINKVALATFSIFDAGNKPSEAGNKGFKVLLDIRAAFPKQLSYQAVGAGIGPVGIQLSGIQIIQNRPRIIDICMGSKDNASDLRKKRFLQPWMNLECLIKCRK